MPGLMQDYPLPVHTVLDHAALNHAEDEIMFVDETPHSATGKIQKMEPREQFKLLKFTS